MRRRLRTAAYVGVVSVALVGVQVATSVGRPAPEPTATAPATSGGPDGAGAGSSTTAGGTDRSAPTGELPAPPEGPARPALTLPDPALTAALDLVVGASPADTCLTVTLDGQPVYDHRPEAVLVPASNEKLLTAGAVLARLDGGQTFRTELVAAVAPVDGVVFGDLTVVGGGDPTLTTTAFATVRPRGDRPTTSVDALVDQLVAAGVTRVAGRIVADESRYDQVRVGPTWPDRYLDQRQTGPLSALDVNDGYVLVDVDGELTREKPADPAQAAAQAFSDLARSRGIIVDGEPGVGVAPAGAVPVAGVDSAPLSELVQDMVEHSDNQTAELLTKELGRSEAGAGTTAAGVGVITAWAQEEGVLGAGSAIADGSGLDPANKVSCPELVRTLAAAGGPEGAVAAGLPVAAESGTLAGRFQGTTAAGKLRAKSGSLDRVTSLSGYVELPEGRLASFAYIANGEPVTAEVMAAQDQLGSVLAGYLAPCTAAAGVLAPVAGYLATHGALAALPSMAAALPGTLAALDAVEARGGELGDRCLATAPLPVADLGS